MRSNTPVSPYNGILQHAAYRSQQGIALITVLWVLSILMVIVLSFSYTARTETYATLSFKGTVEKKFIAEAGIERGIMELFYRNLYKNQTIELEGREIWKTDGTPYRGQMGDCYYTVKIVDESGKIDINKASDLILKNFFMNLGIQPEEADILADSILDWRDSDDLHRLHGAEDDYYASLQNPYKAKNAKFDTIEELVLVKGFTPGILYGEGQRKGIMEFLTVHAKGEQINLNAAPKEVLMALPGMSPVLADSIISQRQEKDISSVHAASILGENYNFMVPYITTEGSNTFTIDASGYKSQEKGGYGIRATVTNAESEKHTFLYYKSPVTMQE
jgi:general secretion pathway protein K